MSLPSSSRSQDWAACGAGVALGWLQGGFKTQNTIYKKYRYDVTIMSTFLTIETVQSSQTQLTRIGEVHCPGTSDPDLRILIILGHLAIDGSNRFLVKFKFLSSHCRLSRLGCLDLNIATPHSLFDSAPQSPSLDVTPDYMWDPAHYPPAPPPHP